MYEILFFFLQKKLNRGEKIEFKTVGSEESESDEEGESEEEEEEEEGEEGEEREEGLFDRTLDNRVKHEGTKTRRKKTKKQKELEEGLLS